MIEVEEEEGVRPWRAGADTAAAAAMTASTAWTPRPGTVRFGDGVRGMVPAAGRTCRSPACAPAAARAGNLPAGSIKTITGARRRAAR